MKKQKGKSRDSYQQKMKDILAPDPEHRVIASRTIEEEIQSEHRVIASRTIEEEIQSVATNLQEQQQRKPRKRRHKKKSLPSTKSTDECQTDHPNYEHRATDIPGRILENFQRLSTQSEHQEIDSTAIDSETHSEKSKIEQQQQRTPSNDERGCTSIAELESAFTQGLPIESEQEILSNTNIDGETRSEESPINFNQPTWKDRVAERLSVVGTVEYHLIPTRSYWLSTVGDDWGTTDDETKAIISARPFHLFVIEVCGRRKGYGVILRNTIRNPIIVISRVSDYVSPFYHELQGVSLGLKLVLRYKIRYFRFDCISEKVAIYVMDSWTSKDECGCPPRDNPKNPREKKYYCVECSKSILDYVDVAEKKNFNKILPLIDEILHDALEYESRGNYGRFYLFPAKLSKAKAVWHLANSGIDRQLRIDEIEEDEEIAEILYKEVYRHGSLQELKMQKKEWEVEERRGEI